RGTRRPAAPAAPTSCSALRGSSGTTSPDRGARRHHARADGPESAPRVLLEEVPDHRARVEVARHHVAPERELLAAGPGVAAALDGEELHRRARGARAVAVDARAGAVARVDVG